jgi:hypothetical protein
LSKWVWVGAAIFILLLAIVAIFSNTLAHALLILAGGQVAVPASN